MSFVRPWSCPSGDVNGFCGIAVPPKGIGHSRKPIDGESLCRKQDHRDFNDDEFFGLGDDAERNDEGRGSRRRMAYPEQSHQRARRG